RALEDARDRDDRIRDRRRARRSAEARRRAAREAGRHRRPRGDRARSHLEGCMTARTDVARYLSNWQGEVDSAAQYRVMAKSEPTKSIAKVYETFASIEEK